MEDNSPYPKYPPHQGPPQQPGGLPHQGPPQQAGGLPQQGPPQQGYGSSYSGPSVFTVTTQPPPAQQFVVQMVGAGSTCPNCRQGILQDEFTCCGIFLAIICCPLGIALCILMKERRCNTCKISYGKTA